LGKTNDFLGDIDEIKEAFNISRESLKQAHKSFTESELKQAYSEGLINNEQIKEFKQSKHLLEIETKNKSSINSKNSFSL
jgi:hypothetical protein